MGKAILQNFSQQKSIIICTHVRLDIILIMNGRILSLCLSSAGGADCKELWPSPSLAIKPTRVSIATDRHCVQLQRCQHLPYIPALLTWYQADLGQSVRLPMLDSVLSKSRHPGLSQHSPHFDVYKILVQLLL